MTRPAGSDIGGRPTSEEEDDAARPGGRAVSSAQADAGGMSLSRNRNADLVALFGHRPASRSELSWDEAEEHVGFVFPADFKDLVSTFGTGVFDHVVEVVSPVEDEESLDFFFSDLYEYREFAGRVRWGKAGQCTLFWRTEGDPDQWTITWCDSESTEWESYDGTATAFLFDLLTGEIRSKLIEFTPGRSPGFWPD
ncbi:hypothetical protein [Lentzea sp. NPDC003310]|uniref:hypothetical protein n=1 Tax=Lentzea sp. NPDC003310 TaxID=3154447 RepID=UPI0033B2FAA6